MPRLSELAAHADFFSIGTNDLAQYFFAEDRTRAKLDLRANTPGLSGGISYPDQTTQDWGRHEFTYGITSTPATGKPRRRLAGISP